MLERPFSGNLETQILKILPSAPLLATLLNGPRRSIFLNFFEISTWENDGDKHVGSKGRRAPQAEIFEIRLWKPENTTFKNYLWGDKQKCMTLVCHLVNIVQIVWLCMTMYDKFQIVWHVWHLYDRGHPVIWWIRNAVCVFHHRIIVLTAEPSRHSGVLSSYL